MELEGWWIVVGALALLAVIGLVARWREKRRSAALENAALRLGMSFRVDEALDGAGFAGLPLFRKGRSRRFFNVASGGDLRVFGYRYVTGSGKNSSTHTQTVAAVQTRGALPRFELHPEGVFDRIGAAFGGQDVDFDEDPEFSRRYRLRGDDEAALRRLFQPALRQQLRDARGWCVEGQGDWLVLYRRSKRIAPDALGVFVEEVRRLSALFADAAPR